MDGTSLIGGGAVAPIPGRAGTRSEPAPAVRTSFCRRPAARPRSGRWTATRSSAAGQSAPSRAELACNRVSPQPRPPRIRRGLPARRAHIAGCSPQNARHRDGSDRARSAVPQTRLAPNVDRSCTFMHDHAENPQQPCAFMSILAAERQQHTLDRLGRDGRVLAAALAEIFSTSEDTICRDLRDLAGRGLCRRVYGGALPVSPASSAAQVRAGGGDPIARRRWARPCPPLSPKIRPGLRRFRARQASRRRGLFPTIFGSQRRRMIRRSPRLCRLKPKDHALADLKAAALILGSARLSGGRTLADIEALRPELALLGGLRARFR